MAHLVHVGSFIISFFKHVKKQQKKKKKQIIIVARIVFFMHSEDTTVEGAARYVSHYVKIWIHQPIVCFYSPWYSIIIIIIIIINIFFPSKIRGRWGGAGAS